MELPSAVNQVQLESIMRMQDSDLLTEDNMIQPGYWGEPVNDQRFYAFEEPGDF